ncbi:MAG: transcriptional regulator [Salinibacter sp.]|uniref:transcriptional regulator n=1 Tax=Salinibacter sp. TaxID=2065818 RepID=UPI0035D4FD63
MSSSDPDVPFERLAELDKLIHEPARLSILTALSSCGEADFTFLRRLTGLTRGNLSSHLSRLEDAGLVDVDKSFEDKTPVTTVSLSEEGRRTIVRYWDDLQALRDEADQWDADDLDSTT